MLIFIIFIVSQIKKKGETGIAKFPKNLSSQFISSCCKAIKNNYNYTGIMLNTL